MLGNGMIVVLIVLIAVALIVGVYVGYSLGGRDVMRIIVDSCETDTACRDSARRIFGVWVDGDSHAVPPLESMVERLVQRIEALEPPNGQGEPGAN